MTHIPESAPQPTDGKDALQDGWVTSPRNLRKSATTAFDHQDPELKTESKSWDFLQDGWDKQK